ncbi:MAG TPA: hypothetical protein VG963_26910 [Polyangiaceae bacterium]|nr:hypothetical protein [Polyangiaceae bacterium]
MPASFSKRTKEKARQERQRDKALERQRRKLVRQEAPARIPGIDPDIADIVIGPQLSEGE